VVAKGDFSHLGLFLSCVIIIAFFVLISTLVWYLYESEPDIERTAMEALSKQFATSVTNAHWQWRAEGEPNRIVLVHYDADGNENNRRPIAMGHLGYPKVEPSSQGCGKLWRVLLDMPLTLNRLKVYAEYYDGIAISDNILDSYCRYRLLNGPMFDYKIYRGRIEK
jgi:hypothetical protein